MSDLSLNSLYTPSEARDGRLSQAVFQPGNRFLEFQSNRTKEVREQEPQLIRARNSDSWSIYDYLKISPKEELTPWEGNRTRKLRGSHSPDYRQNDRLQERQTERPVVRDNTRGGGRGRQMLDRAAREAGGRTGRLIRTSQGIYLRSNFDVDVDGSPRARQIDRYGQIQTSWSYSKARGHKYINAERVPYIVLPLGKYKQFGIKLGDYALVRDRKTNRVAAAVFADQGPRRKTGEGSIYLGNAKLGLNVTPNRGISAKRFEYLVFPGSSEGRARNEAELLARIRRFESKMLGR